MFLQSKISAIAELTVFYSMFVSVNSLRHNPTIKTEAKQYGYEDLSYGFLGYPVSQAADITFCNADLVPVGEDQLPHIEQTRKIVRRFNELYGNIIKEPSVLLSTTPRLIGLDGNSKMGKSLGNAIYLSDPINVVNTKVRSAVTDATRISIKDKGHPDTCTVSKYHATFNDDEYKNICNMCKNAAIGCVACKKLLAERINTLIDPFREKRSYYEQHKNEVRDIIIAGSDKANLIGDKMVVDIKKAMSISI
jgi:tryptophanyl-tRNA synthetase